MATNNRFKAKTGAFKCRCCSRSTRDTGEDNTELELCIQCYELCMIDNKANDYGLVPADVAFGKALMAQLARKGVTRTTAIDPELLK